MGTIAFMLTDDLTALVNQNATIILRRLDAAAPELQLVVHGALIDSRSLTQLNALEDAGIRYISPDQLGRRLDILGLDRLHEVFAVFAPGCELALMEAWQWMRTQPHRSRLGFVRSLPASEKPHYEELQWLQWMANDILITGCCDPIGLAKMAGGAVGNRCTRAAADFLATAIVKGGAEAKEIVEVLLDTLRGKRPGQGPSRLIIWAILRSNQLTLRAELGLLMTGAGLEESVIKLIAESAHEGNDEAFLGIIRCFLASSLWRHRGISEPFSAWTGAGWKPSCIKHAPAVLEKLAQALDSKTTRQAWIENGDAQMLYWALYVDARNDAVAAATQASAILKQDNEAGRRFAALLFLTRLQETSNKETIVDAMLDKVRGIALLAATFVGSYGGGAASALVGPHCLDLIKRLNTEKTTFASRVWPWHTHELDRSFLQRIETTHQQREAQKIKLNNIVAAPIVFEAQLDIHAATVASLKAEEPSQENDRPRYWQTKLEQIGIENERVSKALLAAIMDGSFDGGHDPDRDYIKTYCLTHKITSEIASWTDEEATFAMIEHLLFHNIEELTKTGMHLLTKVAQAGRASARCRACAQRYLKWKRIRNLKDVPIALRPIFDVLPEEL